MRVEIQLVLSDTRAQGVSLRMLLSSRIGRQFFYAMNLLFKERRGNKI